MSEILYTEREGGKWIVGKLNMSEERIMKWCETQMKDCIDSFHKVTISDGDMTIKATAIMFHSGVIWDAILSGYSRISMGREFNYPYILPKCFPHRFELSKKWCDE